MLEVFIIVALVLALLALLFVATAFLAAKIYTVLSRYRVTGSIRLERKMHARN